MSRALSGAVVLLLVALVPPVAAGEISGSPSRLRRAAPWTTSTVRGSPDPPLPYRTEQAFRHLTFKSPVIIAPVPGEARLLVAEQEGRIYTFSDDPSCREADLFFDMRKPYPALIAVYGLAFDPDYLENRTVHICYVLKNGEDGTRVSRFRVEPGAPMRCDPDSEEVLLSFLGGGHNGGCLQFGPDRHLYISTGDGTGPFPPDGLETGQDNRDLLSSILRIAPYSRDGAPYSVPTDNPFVGVKDVRPEIWAYGFRNPWKMSFDPRTGDLWVGDVGWELWEMIYRVERGGNYGWSVTEGRHSVHPDRARGLTPILPPVVDHSHSEARSITGGRVYLGERLRDLQGAYVYADYETGIVWGLRHDGAKVTWHEKLAAAPMKIVAFGEDRSRELYLVDHAAGTIHRLAENDFSEEDAAFPRRLSETGLFTSTKDETTAPGVVPYVVNAEPWVDHATARRWIALPGETQIERPGIGRDPRDAFRDRWTFPLDTVLVRTFELEMERGNPASRRRIETQLLHLAGEAWRGYTYAWSDDQTDATLVGEQGLDRTFRIVDAGAPGGERRQTWRFFGRGECIVCHNHFNGYVLGFNLRQLNRTAPDPEGGDAVSQLLSLENHGIFSRSYGSFDQLPRFPSPHESEDTAALTERARAYLHVNCSPCHQRHGGGTSWMELLYEIPLEKTYTVGRSPSQGTFGIDGAALVSPGQPERSLLYYRMATLGPPRMPHMGSSIVDGRGLDLIRDWIAQLGTPASGVARPEQAGLAALRSPETGPARAGEVVERIVDSTNAALLLIASLDRGEIPDSLRDTIVEHASAKSNLNTRGLFARFLPPSRRVEELGVSILPEPILARQGNVARGGKLFLENEALQCRTCHTVDGTLGSVGPDLSLVGMRRARYEVLQSILKPAESVPAGYVPYLLVKKDGQALAGIVTKKAAHGVTLKDAQNRVFVVETKDVEALSPQPGSLMPEHLLRGLTVQEAADLLDYLCSLR